MISTTLMKQTIKANFSLWVILTGVQAAMVSLIASTGIPVQSTGQIYYNMLPGLLSAVYVIITSNKLIASQVDKGTMAYILSTPVKRLKVAVTQITFFIGSLFLMFVISAGAHILSDYIAMGDINSSDIQIILLLNLGLFVLNMAFSGICFLTSCIFNLSKYVVAVGGGIVGAFLLLSIMAMFGETFQYMKNFTIVSLYDISSITETSSNFIWKFIVLAGIGAVTYIVSMVAFTKRDLPL
ncbi:hypothetical protein JTF06_09025 [Desemzia sp. RIT804]|uniref:hypothetical protein n=1 Tax=Desemzia sp. RIT 804 TaxID=2810209 RepID=UPI00195037C6|nr:hypothetical protein [Desemzia sp. RIT 804]MBM6615029.1 hypothetical protein [Desemzia sp. RIT 804]